MADTNRPNFESINYNLRPAKNIERKMLSEAFGRLSVLDNIRNYKYIGFGSAYFTDFNLFHKILGISKLLSIEKERDYEERINFNKPFSCIDVEYGPSSEVLPSLDWKEWDCRTIVWLDYTQKLQEYMLGDITTVISQVKSGSMFLISVNIDPDKYEGDIKLPMKEWRHKMLEKRVNKEYIPKRAYDLNLGVENNKSVIWEIVDNTIRNAIMTRNGIEEEDVLYKQLFNIYYKDGANMLTVGGIIYDNSIEDKITNMSFNNLHFVREDHNCFDIIVPNLTYREIHALDMLLPTKLEDAKNLPIAEADIVNYANIYRYFPTFAESNL